MQSFEIEYQVSNALDGTTHSPPFIPENEAPSGPVVPPELADLVVQADDDNIYRFEVENLGLVDPTFGGEASFADRVIVGLWINSPTPGGGGAQVAVISERDRDIVYETPLPPGSLAGLTNVYRRQCIFVPQGCVLGFVGFDASADPDDIIVRMHVKQAENLEDYALLLESCCCELASLCVTPEVTNINPTSVDCLDTEANRTITVTGGPFTEDTTIELIDASCILGESVSITDVTFVDESTMTFVVECTGQCQGGIRVSNGIGCSVDVPDAFTTDIG